MTEISIIISAIIATVRKYCSEFFLLLSGVLVFMVPYACAVWTSYSCRGNVSNEILEFSVLKNLK